jgi:DNA-directed RNA polymerase subunit F
MSIMANIGNTFNIETRRGVQARVTQLAREVFRKNALTSSTNLAKLINADLNNMTFFEELLKSNTLSLSDSKKILTKVFLQFDELKPKNQEELLRFLLTSKSKFFQALTNFESVNANAFKAFKDKLTQFNNIRNNIVLTDILSLFSKDKGVAEVAAAASKKENLTGAGYNPTLAAQFRTSSVTVNSKGSNQGQSRVAINIGKQIRNMQEILEEGLKALKSATLDKSKLKALSNTPESFIQGYHTLEKLVKSL